MAALNWAQSKDGGMPLDMPLTAWWVYVYGVGGGTAQQLHGGGIGE